MVGISVSWTVLDILSIRHQPSLSAAMPGPVAWTDFRKIRQEELENFPGLVVRFHCLQQDILSPFVIQSDSEESLTQVTPS